MELNVVLDRWYTISGWDWWFSRELEWIIAKFFEDLVFPESLMVMTSRRSESLAKVEELEVRHSEVPVRVIRFPLLTEPDAVVAVVRRIACGPGLAVVGLLLGIALGVRSVVGWDVDGCGSRKVQSRLNPVIDDIFLKNGGRSSVLPAVDTWDKVVFVFCLGRPSSIANDSPGDPIFFFLLSPFWKDTVSKYIVNT